MANKYWKTSVSLLTAKIPNTQVRPSTDDAQLDKKDPNISQISVKVKQNPSGSAPTSGLPYFELDQPYFEPEVMYEFPTSSSSPRIPHIIHQTYKTEAIPMDFQKNVQSFIRFNPNWKYMFWTDETARQFIQAMYPDFLVVWDNYRNNVNKADALRYFVLYEFGGIYADLDFECLRPLDPVTRKYAAIFPLEPFEHSALRYEIPFLLNNAIMMSRPRHPFLKHMIDNLSAFQALWEQLDVAGPCFVTTNFMSYNNFTAELGQQLEHARRDRGESHSLKIFLKTQKNRQAEW
ncbi:uncharacterized protein LOC127852528 [Dreissena polymorpha]|uniref:uncharacterized protein LOC127852528 n=1 Tax=Dreissena polymorpha TaxID=45954 RepID=UPI002264965D|nr:uncharacterized protein LOC127852528 [Dreissena polymorpha]